MASPFSLFRKYQAILLAVFGVALMVAFVVGPILLQMMQYAGGGSAQNPVVLTWDEGKVTESEIIGMRRTRSMLVNFVQQIRTDAQKKNPEVRLDRVSPFPMSDSASAVVASMVLAEKARSLGMVVSDQAVTDYLMGLGGGALTRGDLARAKVNSIGTKMNDQMLYDAMREELLAIKLQDMALNELVVTTPASAWEYFNRINRRINAEFLPVEVEDYVAKVTDEPGEGEIKQLYEKYKNDFDYLNDPDPGFKRRAKVKFQYMVANFDKFLNEEMSKVTSQQIAAFYEENKNSFRIDPEETAIEEVVDESNPRQATPRPPSPFFEDDPRNAEPSPPAPVDEEASGETSALDRDEPAAGIFDSESAALQESVDAEGDTQPAEDLDLAPPSKPAGDDKSDDLKVDDDSPKDDSKPSADDDADDSDLVIETDDGEKLVIEAGAPRYKPLEDVEDEIRRNLAAQPAQARLTEALATVQKRLQEYHEDLVLFEAKVITDNPGKFKGQQLAKELELGWGETPLVTSVEIEKRKDVQLGRSYQVVNDPFGFGRERRMFSQLAFGEDVQMYRAIQTELQTEDNSELVFLSWKVQQEESFVPELDKVRNDVIHAWKFAKARQLAREAAQLYSSQARESDKSLKELFGEKHTVLSPAPFSYFDALSLFGNSPEWGVIAGIEGKDSDTIKRRLIRMQVGDIDVLANDAESVFYVAQVVGDLTSSEQARDNFMQRIVDFPGDGPPPIFTGIPGRGIGGMDTRQFFQQWVEQIEKEYNVKWVDQDFLRRSSRES